MSDFKKLYFQARMGRQSDISSYVEAVQNAFANDPADYILNLEYIITSSTGLQTFKPFIEKYGLPIAAYESTMELLEKCVERCETQQKDASLYKEAISHLEAYKEKYHGAFDMFDYYSEGNEGEYIRTYYSSTNGNQNRTLGAGMLKKFGEAAMPDLIITADISGQSASAKLESMINDDSRIGDSMYCEWLNHACTGTRVHPEVASNTLSAIVEDCKSRNYNIYRESVIMDNKDAMYEYTEEELDAIKQLISFKEFVLTGMDESNIDSIMEAQREIYDLYEEMDGIIFESDDHVGEPEKEELVPVYGIIKSYTDSDKLNDGRPKSAAQMVSVKFSKQIKFLTKGDQYSHALVAFNDDLTDMYSFDDEGLVKDSIMNGDGWLATKSIYICAMFVTKSEKKAMKKFCEEMYKNKDKSKYAYSNLIKAYAGKPVKNDLRFVCSSFTSYILQYSNPKNLHRDYSRLRPEDITILPRAFYVMNVKDKNDFTKRKDEMKKKVDKILKEHEEEIDEYNNQLPKILLKDKMTKLKTIDKILDFIISKC